MANRPAGDGTSFLWKAREKAESGRLPTGVSTGCWDGRRVWLLGVDGASFKRAKSGVSASVAGLLLLLLFNPTQTGFLGMKAIWRKDLIRVEKSNSILDRTSHITSHFLAVT